VSYARFGWDGSDVYVYEHYAGFIECCGCMFCDWEKDVFPQLKTAREALEHLDKHVEAGHCVPADTFEKIRNEYPDLDKEIEPYVTPPEVRERQLARMRELFGKTDD
jgi:hypothetical protein